MKKHLVIIVSVLLLVCFALTACTVTVTTGVNAGDSKEESEVSLASENSYAQDINSDSADSSLPIDVQAGDYITFGHYEQDNDFSNGKENIEWLVLDIQDGKALVISKYALDYQPYNNEYEEVTWETCTLRTWLNSDFFNSAFSADEKKKIPTVTVCADENTECDVDQGNDTQDKVFLLSINEAEKYFSSNYERRCKHTEYVRILGCHSCVGVCLWWLRTVGLYQTNAADVAYDGSVFYEGNDVSRGSFFDDYAGIRPAMWIDLGA